MSKRIHPVPRSAMAAAVAACAFQLPAMSNGLVEIQVTPAGEFRPNDGREMKVPFWHIDSELAAQAIARFNARITPLVIDYEHQTLLKEKNGQPAPAAGWFRELLWRDGEGLFARVDLTALARQRVDAKEYLFFSPVFTFDETGGVHELLMGAITNTPGIDGMQPIALRDVAAAAAQFGLASLTALQEIPMNELLKRLLEALGLPADSTADQAIEAVNGLKSKTAAPAESEVAALCAAVGVPAGSPMTAVLTAVGALQTRAAGASPDLSQYVPLATFEQVKNDLAALNKKLTNGEVDQLVKDGLATGKLLPAQEKWARDLGSTDLAALTSYLDVAQPIPALAGTQTGGKKPKDGGEAASQLTTDQLAICTNMGLDPAAYAKNLPAA